ncbi:MAG TPA: peptidoglycan DD-metalloendopeptidase family protein [Candidatus Limnocylindrales bacterium]|nr:peptidoglycan DD-metalloendopeptidase family protein [Candidatus Limnocylindrales bacterium]
MTLKGRARVLLMAIVAALGWLPASVQNAAAVYCYPGDPPAVYQACLAYNAGIGQQVNNENQLNSLIGRYNDTAAQINAIDAMIASLNNQIAAQRNLIAQTKAAIDDLNMRIRFGEAAVIQLQATVSVREETLNQRLRYIDSHGSVNYLQLVLTSNNINQLLNRIVGAQQVAASDKRLLGELDTERRQVDIANSELDLKRDQVQVLLQQQQATEAELEKTLATQRAAVEAEHKLQAQISAQYAQVQAERAKIDAQVAQLYLQYAAQAEKAGGGNGVFEWPVPACGYGCITQGFGCSTFYLEVYDPSCPYPHKIHTGVDIAGPYGTPIVAADTGVAYLYPGSVGYGNLLVIIHGNGYSTYYGHLAGYAPGLGTGQVVPRGTTVAFEGSTGWSTGPHLHFEIRVNGVYKDPCIWLGC